MVVGVFFEYSGELPHTKTMRLIGISKLALVVSESVNGCLCHEVLNGLVTCLLLLLTTCPVTAKNRSPVILHGK